MATLHDVAKLANVSIATVSRALSGHEAVQSVSDKTRRAVEQAAEQLGYRPSAAARALKTGRTRLIGVIASDFLDSYYGEMASGIELEASASDFAPVLASAKRDPKEELLRLRLMREQNAAGVVFCGSSIAESEGQEELLEEVQQATNSGMRVVSLAPRGFGSIELITDNEATGYDITRYFLDTGHHKIAFFGGVEGLTSAQMRIAGYLRAMHEAGEVPQVLNQAGMAHEDGRAAARTVMASRIRPTAIVATNDELAIGALAELWSLGFKVPDDVSVACVGGTRTTRAFEMTHIALPLIELGRLAAAYIINTAPQPSRPNLPAYRFVLGRTTRRLN